MTSLQRGVWSWRLVVVVLILWTLIAWVAARSLVVREELEHADAIVVLAGAATHRERAQQAIRLFNEGRAPLIILTNDGLRSGWSREQELNPLFVERAAAEIRRGGVPLEKILIVPQPLSGTYEEAVALRRYATEHGFHSLLIVTSAYHSRRARWTFQRVYQGTGTTIGLEPVPTGRQTPGYFTWWLSPGGWRFVVSEYLKTAYYHLRYRHENSSFSQARLFVKSAEQLLRFS
jgi:uncharacterized SAM-binding protein YcdF (DUF218 family)